MKYTHLHISYLRKKSDIWKNCYLSSDRSCNAIFFHRNVFLCKSRELLVLMAHTAGQFHTVDINCKEKLLSLCHYQYCYPSPECTSKTGQIGAAEPDPRCYYCFFIFHPFLTTLELMLPANERACYYYY